MNTENSPIYNTGFTPEGKPLIGGVWTLWHQDGFPLEMSHLICQGNGWAVDWAEAMADASTSNNLPALVKHIEAFLSSDTMTTLKSSFYRLVIAKGGDDCYCKFLAHKRSCGHELMPIAEEKSK